MKDSFDWRERVLTKWPGAFVITPLERFIAACTVKSPYTRARRCISARALKHSVKLRPHALETYRTNDLVPSGVDHCAIEYNTLARASERFCLLREHILLYFT